MRTLLPTTQVVALLFACCLLFTNHSKAQYVTIPDANFVTWLNASGYSGCMNGSQMDTTCTAITTATSVYCSHASIQNLNGVQYFDNLVTLNCSYNAISSLPVLRASVEQLYCDNNAFVTLPALPPALRILDCGDNQLTAIPTLPSTLEVLRCSENFITSIAALPAMLTHLQCMMNRISVLPALPAALEELDCRFNPIHQLPNLPFSLLVLDCSNDSLTSLPLLPATLNRLECVTNQLTALPALPATLTTLNCFQNYIAAMPALPASLLTLVCYSNNITSLGTLPPGLRFLECHNNPIAVLPALPSTLKHLNCSGMQLSALPELPDSMEIMDCGYNPALYCLPQLKRIDYLDFDGTGVACLPNYGNVANSNPPLSAVPLCDTFNPYNCNATWKISGRTFFDDNNNCQFDSADVGQKDVKIQLWNNGVLEQQVFTGGQGFYSFNISGNGIYNVKTDTAGLPFIISCPPNNQYNDTLTALDSLKHDNNFAMKCKPGFDLAAHCLMSPLAFRPASVHEVSIMAGDLTNFYGVRCASGIAGTVVVTITGPARYVGFVFGSLAPTSATGNTITWNIADFGLTNLQTSFKINVQVDTTAQIGQQVCFNVNVTPTVGDNNPANNTLTICAPIVNSYDPNDKRVYPDGNITSTTDWLTYTIRFQNTGNAEALNIYVDDTLDVINLDISTFQLLTYSHQPVVQILEGGIARFNFPNINLPDSNANEPGSHGYVQYKIKLLPNKAIGTQIRNTAYIYFDFNTPVVTNTTLNTIALPNAIPVVSLLSANFIIFPNPANNYIQITTDANAVGGTLIITDITGREITRTQLETVNFKLETVIFPAGLYFVTLKAGAHMVTKKLVIE